jgi:uncharacterized phiE125 gp8 family phage protein
MGVFIHGWTRRHVPAHAVSVLVQPSTAIVSASIANPSVITTATPHYLVTGDIVTVAGVAGSTPDVNGARLVTVLSATTFSIPVNVTVGGTGGTVRRTRPVEPLTVAEGKLRAGLVWEELDEREALMTGFIAAARAKVEQDTGLALLTQVRDVYLDALSGTIQLPMQSLPLQSVSSVTYTDTDDALQTVTSDQYVVDVGSGRIGLALAGSWPTDLRPFQPIVIRIVSGYRTIAEIPPLLIHAVGLLTAHYATVGRDLTTLGTIIATTPQGYDDAISSYLPVTVA